MVFALPAPIGYIAYYNKAVVYGLLFEIAAETLITIAADPKHLGAQVGATLVLHTWGSALTHQPHVHGIVPGGACLLMANKCKDYRDKSNPDRPRHKTMTLTADEFMRRFLLHVLPLGFHRIRHFGLIANNGRKEKRVLARQLLNVVPAATIEITGDATTPDESTRPNFVCAHCGAQMILIESFVRGQTIRAPPLVRAGL